MEDPQDTLERAAAGDETAWRAIVSQYQRLVYATIRSFRISPDDAQDVFQEAFLRLHRHSSRLRDSRALTRWIIVTTRHLCIDHLASQRRSQRVPAGAEPEFEPADEDSIPRLEMAQRVRESLGDLDLRCRDLLHLLFFEQERPDYRAAAARFGVPVGSIGPTRARCLEQLLRHVRRREALAGERP